jgi:hypothetical protein
VRAGWRTHLIDVFVFEGSRATESGSEVLVETVCAPKEASSALELHVVDGAWRITLLASV